MYIYIYHNGMARDLAVHPDGLRLAVPCFDQSLRVFDLTPAP